MNTPGYITPMNRYEVILRELAYLYVRGFKLTDMEELMVATATGVMQSRQYGPSLGDLHPPPFSKLPENVTGVLFRYAG